MRSSLQSRPFLRGLNETLLTLSRPAVVLNLLVQMDQGRLNSRSAIHVLRGANMGFIVLLWPLVLLLVLPWSREAGFVLLAASLLFRLGLRVRRPPGVELLVGIGTMVFAAGHIVRLLPLADMPLTPDVLGIVVLLVAAGVAGWSFGTSMGVHLVILALSYNNIVPPFLAFAAMCTANLGGVIADSTVGKTLSSDETRKFALFNVSSAFLSTLLGVIVVFIAQGELSRFAASFGTGAPGVVLPVLSYSLFTGVVSAFGSLFHGHLVSVIARMQLPGKSGRVKESGASGGHTANRPEAGGRACTLHLVRFDLPDAVESNLELMRGGLCRMADSATEMLMNAMNAEGSGESTAEASGRAEELYECITSLLEQIIAGVAAAVQKPCSTSQVVRLQQQQRIAYELRNAGRDIRKFIGVLDRVRRKGYRLHKKSEDELFDITARVLDFLQYNVDYLRGRLTGHDPEVADSMETLIDSARDQLKNRARKNLEDTAGTDIRGELAFMQAVGYLEHVGDRCSAISEVISDLHGSSRSQ